MNDAQLKLALEKAREQSKPPPVETSSPDLSLGEAAIEAVGNIPSSAAQFGTDIMQPVMHPVQTAEALANMVKGYVQKLTPGVQDEERHADAVNKFFADRYGGWEEFKRTLAKDPVGMLGDVSLAFSGGGTALARLPGITGKIGKAAQTTGRLSDPLSIAGRAVANPATALAASHILGTMTGTGAAPLREAVKAARTGGEAAKTFLDNMRQKIAPEDVVVQAKIALGKLRSEKGAAYKAGMTKISKDQTVLDFGSIDKAIDEVASIGVFKGKSIKPSTEKVMKAIKKAVADWKKLDPADYHTPEGLDALKQKIGNIADAEDAFTQPRLVADQVYHAIKDQIVQQAPDYARVMKEYERASDLIREIDKALSLGKKVTADTALRKLTSIMRNNVNTNFGARLRNVQALERADPSAQLMPAIAGQSMSSWAPRGLQTMLPAMAGLGAAAGQTLWPLLAAPFMSPRLMGEAAHLGRRVGSKGPRALGRSAFQAGRMSGLLNDQRN